MNSLILALAPLLCSAFTAIEEGLPTLFDQPGFQSSGDPQALAVGDLDGNGLLDVVVCDFGSEGVQIRLQTAPFAFTGPAYFEAGVAFEDVEIGDMNADGIVDLIALDSAFPSVVHVGLGDGSGGFPVFFTQVLSGMGEALKLADMDADGRLDVLVVLSDVGSVALLQGLGNGDLQSELSFPCELLVNDLDIGDMNGDGFLDVVTANGITGSVSILKGDGTGQLLPPIALAASSPNELRLGDLDGDGDLDLVAISVTSKNLVVLENIGGEFQPFVSFNISGPGLCLDLCDWDSDGVLDVAVGYGVVPGTSTNIAASILVGDGALGFGPPIPVGESQSWDTTIDVVLRDMDGDGNRDLVAAFPRRDSSLIFYLDEQGATSSPREVDLLGALNEFRMGDMDGDGILDLVTANTSTGGGNSFGLFVHLGDGLGDFLPPSLLGGAPDQLAIADLNNDGNLDVVYRTAGNLICVATGQGDGTLTFASCLDTGVAVTRFSIGDIDMDGNLDVVSINNPMGTLLISRGNGAGTLVPGGVILAVSDAPRGVLAVDLDGDGDTDVVVVEEDQPALIALFNDGFGNLSTSVNLDLSVGRPSQVLSSDFNRDGSVDLVTDGFGSFRVLYGLGGGSFSAPTDFVFGSNCVLRVGDVNRDGWPDLSGGDQLQFAVALNDCAGGFQSPYVYEGITVLKDFAVRDLDGDGWDEALLLDSGDNALKIYDSRRPSGARAHVRNGSGTNPLCFSSLSNPVLGSDWISQVDSSAFPAATLSAVFGYDQGLAGVPTVFGELLVAPEPMGVFLASSLQAVIGASSVHSLAIPTDTNLIGTFVATQAALIGGGTSLCNAIDLSLGT